jgi:hypothetical protein
MYTYTYTYETIFYLKIASALLSFGFFIQCPQIQFSGVTLDQTSIKTRYYLEDLTRDCNRCPCGDQYEPVCGIDNVQVVG